MPRSVLIAGRKAPQRKRRVYTMLDDAMSVFAFGSLGDLLRHVDMRNCCVPRLSGKVKCTPKLVKDSMREFGSAHLHRLRAKYDDLRDDPWEFDWCVRIEQHEL